MMQISSTLPSQDLRHSSHARTSSINTYRDSLSPLNPVSTQQKKASKSIAFRAITCLSSSSTEIARSTISNLEKLLQKKNQLDLLDPQPVAIEHHSQDQQQQQQLVNVPSPSDDQKKRKVEGLTLARLWSGIKEAAEEVSPRQFTRLRRLFSKSQEYSPRNNLSQKWRDYHGSNNWAGLLDPLDENLRREIVRFGEFVQSSYQAFHSNPAMSTEAAPGHRHVALAERSYRVTKSLYATSSVGLPKWVDDVAPDLGWMTQRSSWIGYVAVCDDRREIQRMGRRDIIIALRGTSTCMEWAENMRNVLVPLQDEATPSQAQPKVECGFLSLYKTRGEHVPSLAESVVEEVKRLMEEYRGEELSITITGHSLGAALSLLVADEVSVCAEEMPPIAVFSFGGPRVGNRGFAERLESRNVKVLRIVNSQDLITKVPGMFIVSDEIDKRLDENSLAAKMLNEFAYAHVGVELKVDTKMSPYLKPDADIACCHDLEAYLHLVDGFLASNCPFRANAKRSLAKLMHEQGSNVKKLYTSKAKDLKNLNVERKEQLAMSGYMPSPST